MFGQSLGWWYWLGTALLAPTLLSRPRRGNVLQGLPAEPSCCRLEQRAAYSGS